MAILPTCPDLRVEIIDSLPLGSPPPKTLATYVEVSSGTNFGIRHFIVPPFPNDRAVSKVATDGNEIDESMHHARLNNGAASCNSER
ncbi:hypothetical protein EJ04DRAFT_511240 [Polyplosphaeria fusca]|uniref:Uncharacterized protein n=1 Tax=Polyplosphaeria fusca TaxID=682080 RepID=A0A9P4R055_9PLEO|nr:hypothetical protein EJ04DRAFT_511240 [Polyplosphaeria fusca]